MTPQFPPFRSPTHHQLLSRFIVLGLGLVGLTSIAFTHTAAQAKPSPSGWLMVQRLKGDVTYRRRSIRVARLGDRLDQVGAGLATNERSAAKLKLDSNIGSINVAENTRLRVKNLAVRRDGARVTVLDIPRGQVRLQVRKFLNPNSRLEIQTPSGVAAVRGTEFGVSTDAEERTAVGTLSGAVETTAQKESVLVSPGFASVIWPGEAPLEPFPLDRDLRFNILDYRRMGRQVSLVGEVNRANTVLIDGQPISVSREGQVETLLTKGDNNFVEVVVSNPLGESRTEKLWLYRGK